MSLQVTAGQKVTASIVYLDQFGNPMLTAPPPDSPPAWTNSPSAPGIDTLTASTDGSSATLATNPGDANSTDTMNLSVTVGGKTFTASLAVAISAQPQVLSGVAINATVA